MLFFKVIKIYTLNNRRICTVDIDEEKRNQRLEELKTFLTKKQYTYKLVENGIKKANELITLK